MSYPSTFVDIQRAVIAKARLSSDNDTDKVKDWLNQIYADACLTTEVSVTSATMNLTAGSASYTFPDAIMRIKEMVITPSGATVSKPLKQSTLDEILSRRQASGGIQNFGGYVTHYALLGVNDFEVWPTPQAADVLTIYYVAAPTALDADEDVPSLLPEPFASKVLEFGALAEAADFKGDPAGAQWAGEYQQWLQKLRAHLTRKQGSQPGQFRVWNSTVFPPHDPSTDVGGY